MIPRVSLPSSLRDPFVLMDLDGDWGQKCEFLSLAWVHHTGEDGWRMGSKKGIKVYKIFRGSHSPGQAQAQAGRTLKHACVTTYYMDTGYTIEWDELHNSVDRDRMERWDHHNITHTCMYLECTLYHVPVQNKKEYTNMYALTQKNGCCGWQTERLRELNEHSTALESLQQPVLLFLFFCASFIFLCCHTINIYVPWNVKW